MSMMILHDQKETDWSSLGYGPLNDAINPSITRARNAEYTLEFSYPVNGPLFDEIKIGNWVVSDAGPKAEDEKQRFEIQTVTKPINGIISVYAEHYRYQLLRAVLKYDNDFTGNVNDMLNRIIQVSLPNYDFKVKSVARTSSSTITLSDPTKFENTMAALGGTAGSILDIFGGEYIFNNNEISLPERAGIDTQVVVAYGKNMQDISQEESIENVFTSIYPWAKYTPDGGEEQIITLSESYLDSEYVGNYRGRRIQSVDFSNLKPVNAAELRKYALAYIKNNDIGIPKVSIKTSFIDLAKSLQDGEISQLEEVSLCDTITVAFNELNINATAKVTKVVWRPDLEHFESMELGEAKTNLGDVIKAEVADNSNLINDMANAADTINKIKDDLNNFNDVLNNPGEGHVVIYPSMSDPQEIYIMDTTDILTARKMWRWNESGLSYSKTGRNGPWTVGMNKDGQIVADLITTGTLRAIDIIGVNITGSRLVSTGTDYKITIENGKFVWYSEEKKKDFVTLGVGKPYHTDPKKEAQTGSVMYKLGYGGGFQIRDSKNRLVLNAYDNNDGQWVGLNLNSQEFTWNNMEFDGTVNYSSIILSKSFSFNAGSYNYHMGEGAFTMRNITLNSYGRSNINQGLNVSNALWVYGGAQVNGTFTVSGTKSSLVNTKDYGSRLLYAYETPEYLFGTYGKVTTDDQGYAEVIIDPVFLQSINTDSKNYHVFTSEYGEYDSWVSYLENDRFMINTSKPNSEVSWNLVAYRKDYEDFYMETPISNDNKMNTTKDNQPQGTSGNDLTFQTGGIKILNYEKDLEAEENK